MARRKVITTPMMKLKRKFPKSPFVGWGPTQVRKIHTEATSSTLLRYRSCIAGKMSGKSFPNLEAVQKAFAAAAHECREEIRRGRGSY